MDNVSRIPLRPACITSISLPASTATFAYAISLSVFAQSGHCANMILEVLTTCKPQFEAFHLSLAEHPAVDLDGLWD